MENPSSQSQRLLIFVVLMLDPKTQHRLRLLGCKPDEFEEKFARAAGPGGQNVNKVSTSVTLFHRPSSLSVTVQESRSQFQNRRLALERLVRLLEAARETEISERSNAVSRARRKASPRPQFLKRRIRASKEQRAKLKQQRSKVISD
ncbi:MAG: peptide chain release factor-like protein [Verrucomicrobia bacterium]|nr:peptide chain release factor-like protein [Verrucomicrobiota bacterium]